MSVFKYWLNPKDYIKTSRGASKLSKWAKKIYKKNNYTCVACGYRAGGNLRLEAHHIVPKSINPQLAYRISNGVTLCSECHRTDDYAYHAVHGVKGSKEMFDRWLSEKRGEKVIKNDFEIDSFTLFTLIAFSAVIGVSLGYFL
jgi:5-methylcytosine-specific restriction endonuclease McrA